MISTPEAKQPCRILTVDRLSELPDGHSAPEQAKFDMLKYVPFKHGKRALISQALVKDSPRHRT